jgi:hypothetical protein
MQQVSRQRIGKDVLAATNTNIIIELLLETVFSTRSVQSGYKEDNLGDPGCYIRTITATAELEKISGRGSQGA